MKTWGVEVQLHVFLTLALDGGKWSASHPGQFTSGKRAPSKHFVGGWVSRRTNPDVVVVERRKSHYCPW